MALNWYIGPWIWENIPGFTRWRAPSGLGTLDMRILSEMSTPGGTPGIGIFYGDVDFASLENKRDYTLLGSGSWYDIKPTTAQKARIPRKRRYTLKGDDLVGIIYDALTTGADPDGLEGPFPLMPTVEGNIDLHCGQKHCEKFNLNTGHGNLVKNKLRKQFSNTWERDNTLARKMLGFWEGQYKTLGLDSWVDFVPVNLRGDVESPLPPETTLTETFNTADSTTLGPTYSWTEYEADGASNTADRFSVVSNRLSVNTTWAYENPCARAESDLSSTDHNCTLTITAIGSGSDNAQLGPACRFSASAATCYIARAIRAGLDILEEEKLVAGVLTTIGSSTGISLTTSFDIKVQINGSTLKAYKDGTELISNSDGSINSGETRCGVFGYNGSSVGVTGDTWTATDLTASSVIYTQLERGTRGLLRGVYTARI